MSGLFYLPKLSDCFAINKDEDNQNSNDMALEVVYWQRKHRNRADGCDVKISFISSWFHAGCGVIG